jgi:hypothetical protein
MGKMDNIVFLGMFFLVLILASSVIAEEIPIPTSPLVGGGSGGGAINPNPHNRNYDLDIDFNDISINDVSAMENDIIVIAGETITIRVDFTADEDYSDVKVSAELESDHSEVEVSTSTFDILDRNRYVKILTLTVPSGIGTEIETELEIAIRNRVGEKETEIDVVIEGDSEYCLFEEAGELGKCWNLFFKIG